MNPGLLAHSPPETEEGEEKTQAGPEPGSTVHNHCANQEVWPEDQPCQPRGGGGEQSHSSVSRGRPGREDAPLHVYALTGLLTVLR